MKDGQTKRHDMEMVSSNKVQERQAFDDAHHRLYRDIVALAIFLSPSGHTTQSWTMIEALVVSQLE